MKRITTSMIAMMMALLLVLAACGGPPPPLPTQTPAAEAPAEPTESTDTPTEVAEEPTATAEEEDADAEVRTPTGDVNEFWVAFMWDDLTPAEQELWAVLGWDQESWDEQTNIPESENKFWDELTPDEQAAAEELGYDEEIWNDVESTPLVTEPITGTDTITGTEPITETEPVTDSDVIIETEPVTGTETITATGLTGVTWQWLEFQDMADEPEGQSIVIDDPTRYTITFTEDGMVHAQADCNVMNSSYEVDGNQLTIMPGAMTLAACPEDSHSDVFVMYLSQVASYVFDDEGRLVMNLMMDSGNLVFESVPVVEHSNMDETETTEGTEETETPEGTEGTEEGGEGGTE